MVCSWSRDLKIFFEVAWNLLSLEHLFLFSAFLKLQKMLLFHSFIILFDGKHICIWNYVLLEADFKTSDLFWGQEKWHPRKLYWINYRSWRSLVFSKISKAARDCSHSYSNYQMGLCLLILHPRLTFSNQIISSQCRSVCQLSFCYSSPFFCEYKTYC